MVQNMQSQRWKWRMSAEFCKHHGRCSKKR